MKMCLYYMFLLQNIIIRIVQYNLRVMGTSQAYHTLHNNTKSITFTKYINRKLLILELHKIYIH